MSTAPTEKTPPVLYSITRETPAEIIASLVRICFPDARTALDLTYGHGGFWKADHGLTVAGFDIKPQQPSTYPGDFRNLHGVGTNGYDIAVFDPPYHTDMGKATESVMGARFGTFENLAELENAVRRGTQEALRVSRLGVIVKVQNYVHGSKFVHMTRWVEETAMNYAGLPLYDEVHGERAQKMLDPKWSDQLSVYRRHATYLVFRHGKQEHKRRKPPKLQGISAVAEAVAAEMPTPPNGETHAVVVSAKPPRRILATKRAQHV